MKLNQAAIERVAASKMSGSGTANIFRLMAQAAAINPGSSLSMNLGFQEPDDSVSDGDLFPVITLSLQRATKVEPLDGIPLHARESGPGPTGS